MLTRPTSAKAAEVAVAALVMRWSPLLRSSTEIHRRKGAVCLREALPPLLRPHPHLHPHFHFHWRGERKSAAMKVPLPPPPPRNVLSLVDQPT